MWRILRSVHASCWWMDRVRVSEVNAGYDIVSDVDLLGVVCMPFMEATVEAPELLALPRSATASQRCSGNIPDTVSANMFQRYVF